MIHLTRPVLEILKRITWPKWIKDALDERDGHVCQAKGCEVTEGLDIDHILPRALGGKHVLKNLQYLCKPHHKEKTARDMKLISKGTRLAKREAEPIEPGSIQSRGFDKTKTKKFNGQVVPR